jgi:hypothetical protein
MTTTPTRRSRLSPVEVVTVEDWEEQVAAGTRPRPSMLVLDIEPWVAHWSTGQTELDQATARIAAQWPDTPVLVVTNSVREVSAHVLPASWQQVNKARKPTTRGLVVPPGAVLIGDQPLQDGMLAWRLGATFVQVPVPGDAPWWAKLILRLFTPLSWLYLRRR